MLIMSEYDFFCAHETPETAREGRDKERSGRVIRQKLDGVSKISA
jgi:hypothetical protein